LDAAAPRASPPKRRWPSALPSRTSACRREPWISSHRDR
jgi:hypothetical protein